MESDWKTVRLGDLTSWSSGGTPSKANPEFWNGDIPWISASSMKTPLLCNSELKITKSGLENGSRLAETNSILLLVRGSELHNRIPVGVATRPVAFNQDVKALKVRGEMRSDYLFYWLLGNETMLLGKVEQTGIGAGKLDTEVLKNLSIALPPLAEQKAIAAVLGALDDKIELNRRMNATLEAMSRTLFQSWFVDFDPVRAKRDGQMPVGMDAATAALFPDAFVDSPLGMIPQGWDNAELNHIADVIDCLHAKKPERCASGQLYLQLNNILDDGLVDTSDSFFISQQDYQKWISRIEAVEGDCVITNVGRVGAVGQIPQGVKAALGRNITGIRSKVTFPYPTFLIECLVSESMREEIQLKTDSGTILDALNVKSIPKLRFVRPKNEIAAIFDKKARPIRRLMEQNLHQSRTLATLRDTLLPKLLSGELRVSDVASIEGIEP